ncbi:hypothetical protein NQ315_006011 [Exocentrus adspersus]|uniref:non-specific serine/threonine protein kinase n=1 Tax=Exocentrus adspersus TaxID=1586481 RepID=A0AAV8V770_9CUCU|nr:hypothetical protein NQ315_006011 [Exocentrus adspersus]
MSIDDYDILSILGNNINCTTYKVRHKENGNLFVWKSVDCGNKSNTNKELLLNQIKNRSDTYHPNIIQFYNYIDQEQDKILYVIMEYCENSSLRNLIDSCTANKNSFAEELVCKILYQIALTIKTTTDNSIEKFSLKNIFIDKDFNVKLLNFKFSEQSETIKEVKMCQLGLLLYEMCTFQVFNKYCYEDALRYAENNNTFSQSMLSLIRYLIKDKTELRKNINKVLCHPTVLLKAAQWTKEKSFVTATNEKILIPKNTHNEDKNTVDIEKLEELRIKETSLQIRELQLNEWEYKLIMKEKKIAAMERTLKDKLEQIQLHLKHKEPTSVRNKSTKSTNSSRLEKKQSYEDLDSTYVSCNDSILLPTSSKLNVNKIIKPAPFTRTLSERRIRFKGHSPLKDIDFNRRRSIKQPKPQKGILLNKNAEWLTCSEDTDKSSTEGSFKGTLSKAKKLFSGKNTYENGHLTNCDVQCTPIAWTEESKKYAFELLRVMNGDKENQQCNEVKHTHL